ncbi:MAG: S-layer homology domain-containing protein [Caldicoprobacteraceae bacterium]
MNRNFKMLVAVLLIITFIPIGVYAESVPVKIFPDVGNHWAKGYIEKLTAMDIVHGYPDGTCRPDETITRGEFSCLVSNTLKLDSKAAKKEKPTFSETKNNWAEGHIEALVVKNIIVPQDYPKGFYSNEPITRMEITKMMVNAIGKGDFAKSINSNNTGFSDDEDIPSQNKGYVIIAKNYNLIYGYPDNTFKPDKSSTRAEAMTLIVRMLDVLNPPTSNIVHYPNAEVDFELPDFTHTDKNIEFTITKKNVKSLNWSLKKQNDDNSMTNMDISSAITGSLDENSGNIMFKEKGNYELTATATNYGNSKFEFSNAIKVYPIPRADFMLDKYSYTDYAVNVSPTISELGNLDIVWSITKDGIEADLTTCVEGVLSNEGGTIRFKDKGDYILTATITDETGRVFVYDSSIKIYPVPKVEFILPETAHTDENVNVSTKLTELGDLDIVWSITKDGKDEDLTTYIDGVLTKEGGTIRFKDRGDYVLTATITDETGRTFTYDSAIKIYPIPKAEFTLPETAHTDEMVNVMPELSELEDLNIVWSVNKDGSAAEWESCIEGSLDNNGGSIRFVDKGNYTLTATITDETGRSFVYSSNIKIYPISKVEFTLPAFAHTDTMVEVSPTATELGSLNIEWSLSKNNIPVSIMDYLDGTLSNNGGTVRFKDKGSYTLTATVTNETGRSFVYFSSIKIYPVPKVEFTLPEYAHTDTIITVNPVVTELGSLNIAWTATRDGGIPENYIDYIDGTLTNTGGNVRFKEKGNYLLAATVTDEVGRVFTYSSDVNVNPIPKLTINLPQRIHIGNTINIATNSVELGTLPVAWSLKKDGSTVNMASFATANLSNTGGSIVFNTAGNYTLEARVKDSLGREFTYSGTTEAYNNTPTVPVVIANVTRTISNGKFLVTLNANSTDADGDAVTYEYSGKSADNYYAAGTHTVNVRAVDEHGACSAWKSVTFTVVNNPPAAPVITRSPDTNSVAPGTQVRIDATSADPDGDAITYVWDGRIAPQAVYPLGKNVVKVKAVDAAGAESPWAAIVFFVADEQNGGGMTLTGPESTIIEQGIEGATITEYTFTVPPVTGHNGQDYGRVRGYNRNTGIWEQIDLQNTNNGVTMTGTLPAGKYSKMEFYYYTNHTCMYNKSNITYTVRYHFE